MRKYINRLVWWYMNNLSGQAMNFHLTQLSLNDKEPRVFPVVRIHVGDIMEISDETERNLITVRLSRLDVYGASLYLEVYTDD